MADPRRFAPDRPVSGSALLEIRNLNVYYGASHALQGVNITLEHGNLSVVGRNGMGKTTLCKAIIGLVPVASGSIRFAGQELTRLGPTQIAHRGVGYVPQGRRLWPSLTVDEHLRMVAPPAASAWSIERIYDTFPRLAERKTSRGGQLSGGEQQMLAISRALLLNPRLLVMDEPTEGLAPVIVAQVEEILLQLGQQPELAVLIIEQNIGVATEVSDRTAIMINGQINRVMESARLAADRNLQQRLLGVGRHAHEGDEDIPEDAGRLPPGEDQRRRGARKIYLSNPKPPNRWTQPVPAAKIEADARLMTRLPVLATPERRSTVTLRPLSASGDPVVLVIGTLDTKGDELKFIRDQVAEAGLRSRLVDVSTSADRKSYADVPPHQVAAFHRRGPNGVFTGDRGTSVAGMTEALQAWMRSQTNIAGVISAAGSGGTAIAAPAMRMLPVGVPKIMISTVASGDTRQYVGPADIMMMYSVTDVQGLNSISRQVLTNGAQAMIGMVKRRQAEAPKAAPTDRPAIGLTMFGVTTPAVQQITAALQADYECLVFHATGIGGQSMEKLIDSRVMTGVIDLTTTEVCDMMMGGVFPATEDRFGAVIRARIPYIGACGALDMVNFGPPETVPERYNGRLFYRHNPQVTLMRTTAEENAEMGRWIGERLNRMAGPAVFFLPEGGVSLLDAPGQPFHDREADAALFKALDETVRQTASRRLIRLPHNINDPAFTADVVAAFRSLHGGPRRRNGKGRTGSTAMPKTGRP